MNNKILWTPIENDFQAIASWGLKENPFRAVYDYSNLKKELRWLNPEHRKAHDDYYLKRLQYMEFTKNYEHYYSTAQKPIDSERWQYIKERKSWYIMPLGWDNFLNGGRLIDMGCGDGDTIQRVIDYVALNWQHSNEKNKNLHVVGYDLNKSRLDNARKLVSSPSPRITFEFIQGNASQKVDFPDLHFDYSICTGVIEIVDMGEPRETFLNELCRITKRGFYSEELIDEYPGGVPPLDLPMQLARRGLITKELQHIFTEPFDLFHLRDPKKIWPILLDQNLYAERP